MILRKRVIDRFEFVERKYILCTVIAMKNLSFYFYPISNEKTNSVFAEKVYIMFQIDMIK